MKKTKCYKQTEIQIRKAIGFKLCGPEYFVTPAFDGLPFVSSNSLSNPDYYYDFHNCSDLDFKL